jgi:hypothetical protein
MDLGADSGADLIAALADMPPADERRRYAQSALKPLSRLPLGAPTSPEMAILEGPGTVTDTKPAGSLSQVRTGLAPAGLTAVIWVIIGYLLVITILATQVGRLGHMFGRARMYEAGS